MEPMEMMFENIKDIKKSVECLTKNNAALTLQIGELLMQHRLLLKECEHRQLRMAELEGRVAQMTKSVAPILDLLSTKKVIISFFVAVAAIAAGVAGAQALFAMMKSAGL